jgi:hypothetical protein
MSESVKQQLLIAFRRERLEHETKAAAAIVAIDDLERRGSGPLPEHYKIAAKVRGIT